jgi:hypothetical protein
MRLTVARMGEMAMVGLEEAWSYRGQQEKTDFPSQFLPTNLVSLDNLGDPCFLAR